MKRMEILLKKTLVCILAASMIQGSIPMTANASASAPVVEDGASYSGTASSIVSSGTSNASASVGASAPVVTDPDSSDDIYTEQDAAPESTAGSSDDTTGHNADDPYDGVKNSDSTDTGTKQGAASDAADDDSEQGAASDAADDDSEQAEASESAGDTDSEQDEASESAVETPDAAADLTAAEEETDELTDDEAELGASEYETDIDGDWITGEPTEYSGQETGGYEDEPAALGSDSSYDDKVSGTITVTYHQTEARKMLAMVNSLRTEASTAWYRKSDGSKASVTGLSELKYDCNLEKVAMQRAAEIAVSYSHTRTDGTSCFTAYSEYQGSPSGENIAAGSKCMKSSREAFTAWCETNEPYSGQGHRRNMLGIYDESGKRTGATAIGIAYCSFNGCEFWVQEFGIPSDDSGTATMTKANDSSTKVSLTVSDDHFSSVSVSLAKSELTLTEGDTAEIPAATLNVTVKNTYSGLGTTTIRGSVQPTWKVASGSTSYVSVAQADSSSDDTASTVTAADDGAAGQKVNTAYLYCIVHDIAKTLRIYINCRHEYEETLTKATLYSDGSFGQVCSRCGDSSVAAVAYPKTISISKTSAVWNGSAQTPALTVKDSKGKTVDAAAYTVTIKDSDGQDVTSSGCVDTGSYTITVTFNDDSRYEGTKKFDYEIVPRSITDKKITVTVAPGSVYIGSRVTPAVTVTDAGRSTTPVTLAEGTDYTLEWSSNRSAGTGCATVVGCNDYSGTVSKNFTIAAATFDNTKTTLTLDGVASTPEIPANAGKGIIATDLAGTYDGTAKKPAVTITMQVRSADGDGYETYTLREGTDYTLKYGNNTSAAGADAMKGTKSIAPFVTVTGKGNFKSAGSRTFAFSINKKDLGDTQAAPIYLAYKKGTQTPVPVFTDTASGRTLKKGTDFEVLGYCRAYTGDTAYETADISDVVTDPEVHVYDTDTDGLKPSDPGLYTAVCRGKGNYAGSGSQAAVCYVPVRIASADTPLVSSLKITVKDAAFPTEPGVTGTDYSALQTEGVMPSVLTAAKGKEELLNLSAGTGADLFDVTFSNNKSVGTASVTISAKADSGYAGSVTKTYRITGTDIKKAKINNFVTAFTYNGLLNRERFGTGDSDVTLNLSTKTKDGSGRSVNVSTRLAFDSDNTAKDYTGNDYFVTYTYPNQNNAGKFTVTISGNPARGYTGTVTKTVTVSPKKLTNAETDASGSTVTVSGLDTQSYTGSARTPRPVIVYTPAAVTGSASAQAEGAIQTPSALTLVCGEDYTLSYANNTRRAASTDRKAPAVTIKAKGNYTGTLKYGFSISSEEGEKSLFVSAAGNDASEGTLSHPYRTVNRALEQASAGTTVYVRGGTYTDPIVFTGSGSSDGDITLCPFPGENVILSGKTGQDEPIIDLNGCSYITITGFTIGKLKTLWAYGILMRGGESHVTVKDNDICGLKTSDTSEDGGGADGILLEGSGASEKKAITCVTISGNKVHDNTNGWSENISVCGNCANITVADNTVYSNTNIGIDFYGNNDGEGYCQTPSLNQPRNCTATGNTVYNCKSKYAENAGIYVDGARDITVSGNEVYNNRYGIEVGSEEWRDSYGKGISGRHTGDSADLHVRNITVTGNNIHNNPEGGIRIGGYSMTETESAASEDEPCTGWVIDCTVSSNTLRSNGSGSGGYNGEICFAKCCNITVASNRITQSNKAYPAFAWAFDGDDVTELKAMIKSAGKTEPQFTGNTVNGSSLNTLE